MKGEHSSYVDALNDKTFALGGRESARIMYNNTACHLFLAKNFFSMAQVEERKRQQLLAVKGSGNTGKNPNNAPTPKKGNRLYQCSLSHSYEADFIYNEGFGQPQVQ